jgi:hypothetical protein
MQNEKVPIELGARVLRLPNGSAVRTVDTADEWEKEVTEFDMLADKRAEDTV